VKFFGDEVFFSLGFTQVEVAEGSPKLLIIVPMLPKVPPPQSDLFWGRELNIKVFSLDKLP
jgi:hypothetical protein